MKKWGSLSSENIYIVKLMIMQIVEDLILNKKFEMQ